MVSAFIMLTIELILEDTWLEIWNPATVCAQFAILSVTHFLLSAIFLPSNHNFWKVSMRAVAVWRWLCMLAIADFVTCLIGWNCPFQWVEASSFMTTYKTEKLLIKLHSQRNTCNGQQNHRRLSSNELQKSQKI